MLEGDLKETQYAWNREEMIANSNFNKQHPKQKQRPLVTNDDEPLKIAVYHPGDVTGIDDFEAVHVIENEHKSWALEQIHKKPHSVDSIKHRRKMTTLHVYVPNYKNCVILKLFNFNETES